MKKTYFFLLLLFLPHIAIHADIARQQQNNTASVTQYFNIGNPVHFGDNDFYLAWSSRPYNFYILQEYLPKGENFDTYTSMFTASVMFTGDTPMNSAKAVEYKIAELEETKKTDIVCQYLVYENNGEYIVDFIVSKTGDNGLLEFVEADIHYYRDIEINGLKATYLLFISTRAYGDDIMPFLESIPSKREYWIQNLTRFKALPQFKFK